MPWKFGISLLVGILWTGLTNAAGQKENLPLETYTITFDPTGTPTSAIGFRSRPSFTSTNRDLILQKLNKIILPEFGVPKELPLKNVIRSLGAAAERMDPDHAGITFMIVSSAGYAPVEDILIRIDPPLKNVRLQDVCAAISSSVITPPGQNQRFISFSVNEQAVSFREVNVSPNDAVIDPLTGDPIGAPLASGIYKTEPFTELVRVPEFPNDRLMIFIPRKDHFDPMPTFRPDLEFQELIPRSQMNPQVLLDSASR